MLRERECGRGKRTISLDARLVLDEKVMTCPGSLLRSLARGARESEQTGFKMASEKSVRWRLGLQSVGRTWRWTVRQQLFPGSMLPWHKTLAPTTSIRRRWHSRDTCDALRRDLAVGLAVWGHAGRWNGRACRSRFPWSDDWEEVPGWCDA